MEDSEHDMITSTDTRDESALGDDHADLVGTAPPLEDAVVDTTPPLDAETFSIDEFLQGVRPNQRSVKLYMRADLIGALDELGEQIEKLPDDTDDATLEALVKRFNETRDAFYASGRWFTVRSRSQEWLNAITKTIAQEFGVAIKEDGTLSKTPRQAELYQALTCEALAQQIVSPAGVTRQHMIALSDSTPSEFRKLLVAQEMANSSLAQNAKVLTADFSPAPSADTSSS